MYKQQTISKHIIQDKTIHITIANKTMHHKTQHNTYIIIFPRKNKVCDNFVIIWQRITNKTRHNKAQSQNKLNATQKITKQRNKHIIIVAQRYGSMHIQNKQNTRK